MVVPWKQFTVVNMESDIITRHRAIKKVKFKSQASFKPIFEDPKSSHPQSRLVTNQSVDIRVKILVDYQPFETSVNSLKQLLVAQYCFKELLK